MTAAFEVGDFVGYGVDFLHLYLIYKNFIIINYNKRLFTCHLNRPFLCDEKISAVVHPGNDLLTAQSFAVSIETEPIRFTQRVRLI